MPEYVWDETTDVPSVVSIEDQKVRQQYRLDIQEDVKEIVWLLLREVVQLRGDLATVQSERDLLRLQVLASQSKHYGPLPNTIPGDGIPYPNPYPGIPWTWCAIPNRGAGT